MVDWEKSADSEGTAPFLGGRLNRKTCGILDPQAGVEPRLPDSGCTVLITGPAGNSHEGPAAMAQNLKIPIRILGLGVGRGIKADPHCFVGGAGWGWLTKSLVGFEMPMKHPSSEIFQIHTSGERDPPGDNKLETVAMWMLLHAMRLDHISVGVSLSPVPAPIDLGLQEKWLEHKP